MPTDEQNENILQYRIHTTSKTYLHVVLHDHLAYPALDRYHWGFEQPGLPVVFIYLLVTKLSSTDYIAHVTNTRPKSQSLEGTLYQQTDNCEEA